MQSFKQFLLEADLTDKETEEVLAKHLTADQIEKLSKIKSQGNSWQKGYKKLVAYKEKHKHTNVPRKYKTKDGSKFGKWVHTQRTHKKDGTLNQDREDLLNAIDFDLPFSAFAIGPKTDTPFVLSANCKPTAEAIAVQGLAVAIENILSCDFVKSLYTSLASSGNANLSVFA